MEAAATQDPGRTSVRVVPDDECAAHLAFMRETSGKPGDLAGANASTSTAPRGLPVLNPSAATALLRLLESAQRRRPDQLETGLGGEIDAGKAA
jgi:hypothetical protein